MRSTALIALAASMGLSMVVAQGGAMMRFGCAQLVTQRLDPVVQPGQAPSQHLHQIVGGNAFNTTMLGDIGTEATCTTCTFSEDASNYWTPVMYFRARNGTFKRVPQIANVGTFGANGGMTVYYTSPTDKSVKVTAFKPGFRMIVGDASLRKQSYAGATNLYRCYDQGSFLPNPFGVSANDTYAFPKKHCKGGVRVNIMFPTCWDGKNLDSPDHKSHVAYGYNGCPASHPVQLPQIMLETIWDTGRFPQSEWPTDGSQPFVWSQGDGTGYGHHADYVFGWKGDSLQRAVDARCSLNSCSALKTQSQAAGNKCLLRQVVGEDIDGWTTDLPGKRMVTYQ